MLFLCTGNYYRSRFAEELFNFLAPAECPGWSAASRGIAVDLGRHNVGPIAKATARALLERGVSFDPDRARMPLQLRSADLEAADHIVALKYAEHFPLMRERFPLWTAAVGGSRIEYWHVHDVDKMTPGEALPIIEGEVVGLLKRLGGVMGRASRHLKRGG
ncbi:MAG TPA: low molecular weight phosphatase family protein [Methylocystis sp.]|nr:low molecular weight phosphatase family protein [Methylocystis sp.]